ncbi:probable serine carboxypeptidase CPVL [Galendromus occidentalis]|uniref:Carboxypeptidase n=1 Tax=Galendromus occidentalis TaxID=34638 RepID=A0AAJ7PAR1_9ACAR|nr:probable serine carboxypeptidase CPVL [Galendromus occidentalis]
MRWIHAAIFLLTATKCLASRDDTDDPLFLTPFIRAGRLGEARKLSSVPPFDKNNIRSYSGYLTVNETTSSNLFFWFFPARNLRKDAPTLLFLQGGPGASSMFSIFIETGPYRINEKLTTELREVAWSHDFNMLYIDNPVGTGFSFTGSDAGFVTTEEEVGRDLFEALQQFFTLFNEYADNEFYVSGESYAGKYVPATAYTIHKNRGRAKMKLSGIIIGDGWTDPINMMDYDQLLQQLGLISAIQADHFKKVQDQAKAFIRQGNYGNAYKIMNELMDGDQLPYKSYFYNATGLDFYFNLLQSSAPPEFEYYPKFLQLNETRRAIHVGSLPFNDGSKVENKLMLDQYVSAKAFVEEILNNDYKVLIYNGQLDLIVPYALTMKFIRNLDWKNASKFISAPRTIWKNPAGTPVGYVHRLGNFTEALVRNAGHMVPYDQPVNALDLITRFIYNKPFET